MEHVETGRAPFEELARDRLGPEPAALWCSLLRPAITLVPVDHGPALMRLGGLPLLPDDIEWPHDLTFGALSYVGEIDLAAVAATGLDAGRPLPTSGRLLMFHVADDTGWGLDTDADWTTTGRLLYVPDGAPRSPRATPSHLAEGPVAEYGGRQRWSAPEWGNPLLMQALGLDPTVDWMAADEHPLSDLDFREEVGELTEQAPFLGGWAQHIQGAPEVAVSWEETPNGLVVVDPGRWRPLVQLEVDDDHGMHWGFDGVLYWLTCDDPAAPDLGRDARCIIQGS